MIFLIDLAAQRSRELFIATVMACGFITFYSLPDGIPFLVRLVVMVAAQYVVGRALKRRPEGQTSSEAPDRRL